MIRTPRDYQRAIREFSLNTDRANIWAGTGTGKTGTGLDLYDSLRRYNEVKRLLVVSTKRVAAMVWTNEHAKWENFQHLSIATAVGTPDQRIAAIRRNADITTINYENLPWLADKLGEDEWPWDMVIADESTRLKSLRIDTRTSSKGKVYVRQSGGSARAYKIARLTHKNVLRWYNYTGTPAPNGLIDLWGQNWYIDKGQRLGRTFTAFQNRWFQSVRAGDDAHVIKLEPFPHADAEIKKLMRDVSLTIEAKDYFDLPPLIMNPIPIYLSDKARQHYREMEKAMFTEIRENQVEAFNAGSKSMKCRQLASGAVYVEPDDGSDIKPWVVVHDDKIEALKDIVAEAAGAQLIIAYQFRSDLARLQKAFPEGRYFDDKPSTLAAFRSGQTQLWFIHPASAAHGIDGMQDACHNIVWFSMTWNLEEFEQLIERIGPTRQAQAGLNHSVYCHLLVAQDTVDEEMVERIETKASVQDSLRAAMKKRYTKTL